MSGVTLDVKPSTLGLEVLSYLAYETVAQVECMMHLLDAKFSFICYLLWWQRNIVVRTFPVLRRTDSCVTTFCVKQSANSAFHPSRVGNWVATDAVRCFGCRGKRTEHAVRGVAYHPRDRVLQRVGWSMLAGSLVAKEREKSARPRRCGMRENLLAAAVICICIVFACFIEINMPPVSFCIVPAAKWGTPLPPSPHVLSSCRSYCITDLM